MVPLSHRTPGPRWRATSTASSKLLCRRGSRIVAGAVIVSPYASELIHPLTIAVEQRLTVDELAATFTVYPSMSGSIAEAARRLHIAGE